MAEVTRTLRKITGWVGYLLYLALFLLAVDYGFYRHYLSKLEKSRPKDSTLVTQDRLEISKADLSLWNSVDYIHTENRPGRYFLFPEKKPAGVIRIGAFGDSFTYGDEAGIGLDYPSQLQQLFNKAGARNVQVLNFGNDWHGFHQAFRIWDKLGRRYGLDFILLGPRCFFQYRDTTFNHALPSAPYYIHGRYVLDPERPDSLRFIDVKGSPNNVYERFALYYAFFPSWDYLRYDAHPPMFIESLVPSGRSLVNPFYYRRGSIDDETRKIQEILLKRMDASGSQVVLLHDDPATTNVAQTVGRVLSAHVDSGMRFPYLRSGHYGAIGYFELAREFYSALTGAPSLAFDRLGFYDRAVTVPARETVSMASIHHLYIEIAGKPIGELALVTSPNDERMENHPVDPAKLKFRSLLTIKSSSESVLDGWWSKLDFPISPGDPVSIEFGPPQNRKVYPLGTVRFLNSEIPMGYIEFDGIRRRALVWHEAQRILGDFLSLEGIDRSEQPSGILKVASHPVFRLSWTEGDLVLSSLTGPLLKFRASKDMNLDLSKLPLWSPVVLRTVRDGGDLDLPIGKAEKIELGCPYLRKPGQKYIHIRGKSAQLATFEGE